LYLTGYIEKAKDLSTHAELFDPLKDIFHDIQQSIQGRALDDASDLAQRMLDEIPYHPRALFTLAHIALTKDEPEQCNAILEPALQELPANLTLRKMLTDSYIKSGEFAKAIRSAKSMVELEESFDTLWQLIGLLFKYAQYDELLETCTKAEFYVGQDKLKSSQLNLVRGQTLRILGQRQESINASRACLDANPAAVEAWWGLADMKNYLFSNEEKKRIESLIDSQPLSKNQRSIATFALAKATEVERGLPASMSLYQAANELTETNFFNPKVMEREFDSRIQSYNSETLAISANSDIYVARPIFIVGLPRSGSTLVEQILASHPAIEGTIEQPSLPSIEKRAERLCAKRYQVSLNEALGRLTTQELTELGRAYLDVSALFRQSDKPYFTDKQPFNYRLVGLIHKILPQSFIIDIRRQPMDCGLSLYKQYFAAGVDFSYNLKHIGLAYNLYVKLMDHWQAVLPNRVLQVQYEQLVASPEQQVKRILDHIGLTFDPCCLRFYENKRSIHTASSEQVRQPINSKGIGAWETVADSLSDLHNTLVGKQKRARVD
jgi:tetratricopeptide (TPR) repeat protein